RRQVRADRCCAIDGGNSAPIAPHHWTDFELWGRGIVIHLRREIHFVQAPLVRDLDRHSRRILAVLRTLASGRWFARIAEARFGCRILIVHLHDIGSGRSSGRPETYADYSGGREVDARRRGTRVRVVELEAQPGAEVSVIGSSDAECVLILGLVWKRFRMWIYRRLSGVRRNSKVRSLFRDNGS